LFQLAGDDPAAGHRLPAPAGDPAFDPAPAIVLAEQGAGVGFGHGGVIAGEVGRLDHR
jgi:hypothetical protein